MVDKRVGRISFKAAVLVWPVHRLPWRIGPDNPTGQAHRGRPSRRLFTSSLAEPMAWGKVGPALNSDAASDGDRGRRTRIRATPWPFWCHDARSVRARFPPPLF